MLRNYSKWEPWVCWRGRAPRRRAVPECLATWSQQKCLVNQICRIMPHLHFQQDWTSGFHLFTQSGNMSNCSCFSACQFYEGSELENIVLLNHNQAVNDREENKSKFCWAGWNFFFLSERLYLSLNEQTVQRFLGICHHTSSLLCLQFSNRSNIWKKQIPRGWRKPERTLVP